MKITDVRTWALHADVPTPTYSSHPGLITGRDSTVIEIVTDEGISGFGESLCQNRQPGQIAQTVIETVLVDVIRGANPLDTAVLWEAMYTRVKDFGFKGAVIGAISAVDIALHDIAGKALGLPIYQLLGGSFRESLPAYATGFFRRPDGVYPDELVEEAQRHLEAGFRAMKVKIGFGVRQDAVDVGAVREAIGPDVLLMVDANHAYETGLARRLLHELDELDVFWFEEPVSPENIDGYVELRALGTRTLIAAGEVEYTLSGFWPWITRRAVDILQPDVAAAGGFTAIKQIIAAAGAANLLVNPHIFGTGIGLAASLHAAAIVPPCPPSRGAYEPLAEFDQSRHPFRDDVVHQPLRMRDGRLTVPTGPGLGIDVDRTALDRLAV
ncbi:MAG TPA: mandelate racemase/muconate lactonizing enzyme family protein [Solirubrobacteraceae bacterium]|nr:mandelate racemase/muconate lactonizing enzyme family protein [Solirubrobacteraceae bacterium]